MPHVDRPLAGHMLHGVDKVVTVASNGEVVEFKTDGRAYMWSNGAVTIYRPGQPWMIVPERIVAGIVGEDSSS